MTIFFLGQIAATIAMAAPAEKRQITQAEQGHMLTNCGVWSPDGEWIVYDTRKSGDQFDSVRIERVSTRTGQVETIYAARNGAACGVVTHHPHDPEVVFIGGPEHPSPDWSYGFTRRRGIVVNTETGAVRSLDAMNYAPPFVPGALRGGSHVHVFSGDGQRVSFTYEDEVLRSLDGTGTPHEPNQRNVGVAVAGRAVRVNRNHPRNNDGEFFSFLATRTTAEPARGSDEISRACEEAWVGTDGYLRPDGSRQRHALAFQGTVRAADGSNHAEVFLVDLPEDLAPDEDNPLEGTAARRPAPPRGTHQRRLTFTESRKFPGLQGPRHWLRSSPDGTQIGFLMKDDAGIVQFWTVSPQGGAPRQVTANPHDIASAFTWSPDGRQVTYVMDRSIFLTEITTGASVRLTAPAEDGKAPRPYACVFSPQGDRIAFTAPGASGLDQIFTVAVPLLPPKT